ncbi:hypothetical protein Y695_03894 [Hydrogenophaga sp. T4]|nr:hypothetical protein Y695_03894 [Hydrogenophaga sp. T4]
MHVVADANAPAVDAPCHPARGEHARLDGGGDVFPLTRSEQHDVWRKFAQVGQDLVGASGKLTTRGVISPRVTPSNCSVIQASGV